MAYITAIPWALGSNKSWKPDKVFFLTVTVEVPIKPIIDFNTGEKDFITKLNAWCRTAEAIEYAMLQTLISRPGVFDSINLERQIKNLFGRFMEIDLQQKVRGSRVRLNIEKSKMGLSRPVIISPH